MGEGLRKAIFQLVVVVMRDDVPIFAGLYRFHIALPTTLYRPHTCTTACYALNESTGTLVHHWCFYIEINHLESLTWTMGR
jgi:hypothetical protein